MHICVILGIIWTNLRLNTFKRVHCVMNSLYRNPLHVPRVLGNRHKSFAVAFQAYHAVDYGSRLSRRVD